MALLVLLGGPTGVGKSTVLKHLENRLPNSALLDADDVWRISEDLAVAGTRSTAISNVTGVVRGYLQAGCEIAVLAWVFARAPLYEPVIDSLEPVVGVVRQLYLVASPDALRSRLASRGDLDRLEYSLTRLALIESLPYPRIDTTHLSPAEVADRIVEHIRAIQHPKV